MTARTIYLSGPMTGFPEFKFPDFDACEARLRDMGFDVVSPANHDREVLAKAGIEDIRTVPGFIEGNVEWYSASIEGMETESLLAWDIDQIVNHCQAIAMMPGWEQSSGALAERYAAETCGHDVYLLQPDQWFGWSITADPDQQCLRKALKSLMAPVKQRRVEPEPVGEDWPEWFATWEHQHQAEIAARHPERQRPITFGGVQLPELHRRDPGEVFAAMREAGALGADGLDTVFPSAPRLAGTSADRKNLPMARGLIDYFPDALAEVSYVSFVSNEKHNPGEPLHWSKDKSSDHADCLVRHVVERGTIDSDDGLRHSAKAAWRALAMLQIELESERKDRADGNTPC